MYSTFLQKKNHSFENSDFFGGPRTCFGNERTAMLGKVSSYRFKLRFVGKFEVGGGRGESELLGN